MAYAPTRLGGPTALTTGSVTQYTVAAGKTVIVKQVILANVQASPITATVALAGGTLFSGTVPANTTMTFDLSFVLNATETITAQAGAGASVVMSSHGIVFP